MRLSFILAVVAAFNSTVSMPIADSDSYCPYKCNSLLAGMCCWNKLFLTYEDPSGETSVVDYNHVYVLTRLRVTAGRLISTDSSY
ncbi:hypothetical protein BD769DRAFT_1458631 [Suillus cothurnatus]|nr:hypothetical protein BD769DRAFT_1458631 [Suillus cothurnatus]